MALVRKIAAQFVHLDTPADALRIACDEQALLSHIAIVSAGKPVILLIDELNLLSENIDADACRFLSSNFLDPVNRYMVFTTHVPLPMDSLFSPSGRVPIMLPFDPCHDFREIRKIKTSCNSVTPCEMMLYGGIPSLIYCVKQASEDLKARVMLDKATDSLSSAEFGPFLSAVLGGNGRFHPSLRRYSFPVMVLKNQAQTAWPAIYIRILSEFMVSSSHPAPRALFRIENDATSFQSGKDWESIVACAFLMRCYDIALNGRFTSSVHVFSSLFRLNLDRVDNINVQSLQLQYGTETVEAAEAEIGAFLATVDTPTLLLVTPTHSSFEIYDGFLCFGSNKKLQSAIAYQCNLGNDYPSKDAPTTWFNKSFLIRGAAPASSPTSMIRKGWKYMAKDDVILLLGVSLSAAYPANWLTE